MDDPLTKRRRFLQGAGVSGTALLAGCTGILDSEDDDEATPDGDDGDETDDGGETDDDQDDSIRHGDGDTREVGIVAEPDREALMELQQQVQANEIDQAEAIERREEIIREAIEDLKSVLEAETEIEVTEEYPDFGAIRATGDPYELVDSLTSARVSVLVDAEALEIEQPTG